MDKKLVMLGMIIGSTLGSYIPVWFGVSLFSFSSVIGTFVGGVFGIWVVFRFSN